MKELVSIIMPTYNCGRFIRESIGSVLAQTYQEWELIIVDDLSTDDTDAIVRSYEDKRIRYMRNESNMGAALTRNRALCAAKGRYIAFLDADDIWTPDKLEKQIAFMQANNYTFTYHEYTEMDENSQPLGIHVSGKKHIRLLDMMSCCWPGCLTVVYDRTKIGLIQIPNILKNNDSAMWIQAIRKADCYLLPQTMAQYRRRIGSITPTTVLKKIGWHYILFRDGVKMNPVASAFWMCMNIFGNGYKKLFYVKRYKVQKK